MYSPALLRIYETTAARHMYFCCINPPTSFLLHQPACIFLLLTGLPCFDMFYTSDVFLVHVLMAKEKAEPVRNLSETELSYTVHFCPTLNV